MKLFRHEIANYHRLHYDMRAENLKDKFEIKYFVQDKPVGKKGENEE